MSKSDKKKSSSVGGGKSNVLGEGGTGKMHDLEGWVQEALASPGRIYVLLIPHNIFQSW